ncbi:MAG: hypothetical protein DLM68_06440 [Hyphomicrobiales bacterium]|nr:MAG: hypothetical protein DLM68_06440 [Hyphomicrobiales bacterium]
MTFRKTICAALAPLVFGWVRVLVAERSLGGLIRTAIADDRKGLSGRPPCMILPGSTMIRSEKHCAGADGIQPKAGRSSQILWHGPVELTRLEPKQDRYKPQRSSLAL